MSKSGEECMFVSPHLKLGSGLNVDRSGPKVLSATVSFVIFALEHEEKESISRAGWVYWCKMLYTEMTI